MRYQVTFARNQDIDNIQHETVSAKDEQDARSMFTVCDCYVYSVEIVLPPDRDDAAILQAARAIFPNAVLVGDMVRVAYMEAPENLGTHVIISGGEVMEIGRLSPDHEGNYDSDYSSWNEDPF